MSPRAPVGGTVRGVASQHHPAPSHRLGDEGPEPQDGPLGDRPFGQQEPVRAGEPRLQLRPDRLVRPARGVLVRVALEVHPLQGLGPLADEREPPLGVAVDELRRTHRGLREDPEPRERVLAEPHVAVRLGDELAAHAVRPVGADDEPRPHLNPGPVGLGERHRGGVRLYAVHGHIAYAEPDVATVTSPGVGEVDEDVGLGVEPYRRADRVGEVDPVGYPAEAQVDALVLVPVAQDPVRDPGLEQVLRGSVLQDAGAVGRLDLVAGADVDGEALDPGPGQPVGQHEPGRSGPDDRHGHLDDEVDRVLVG